MKSACTSGILEPCRGPSTCPSSWPPTVMGSSLRSITVEPWTTRARHGNVEQYDRRVPLGPSLDDRARQHDVWVRILRLSSESRVGAECLSPQPFYLRGQAGHASDSYGHGSWRDVLGDGAD